MSVTGIASNTSYQPSGSQNNFQQIQADFQQLGQDLQAGNLSQAQQDYATLTAALPSNQQQQQNNNNPIAQAFAQLGRALQSGDLATAQQAFATIQQDFQQNQGAQGGGHHHHHHFQGAQGDSSSSQNSTIGQALSALGQALQSNNLTAAQQAFASLNQALESQLGTYVTNGSITSTSSPSTGSSLNVTA